MMLFYAGGKYTAVAWYDSLDVITSGNPAGVAIQNTPKSLSFTPSPPATCGWFEKKNASSSGILAKSSDISKT